jgi:hypothetical protein
LELAAKIEEFPLGKCNPSDDPDMQWAYLTAFIDLVRPFIAAVKRVGDSNVLKLLAPLEISPEHISEAYEYKANLQGVIDYLREVSSDDAVSKDTLGYQPKRISRSLAAIIDGVLSGSHPRLNSLFPSAGAPGPIPEGSHAHKWRDWIMMAGRDPSVDNCEFIGALIEEFMDVPPLPPSGQSNVFGIDVGDLEGEQVRLYHEKRKRLEEALAAEGLQYFRGGRVIPTGTAPEEIGQTAHRPISPRPTSVDEVLMQVLKGLRRAMYPLTHRRKSLTTLAFDNEYDVQDLLHVLLRPWVKDIRPEEYTPSYAGKSTRMDFLLPEHATVVELKFVRDALHAKTVGQELQIDIGHYRQHPQCQRLWCVVFDPRQNLVNGEGMRRDLEGVHRQGDKIVEVKFLVL